MAATECAREVKHAAWLGKKRVYGGLSKVHRNVRDSLLTTSSRLWPPTYTDGDHPDSFISRTPKRYEAIEGQALPRRVFCLWTGNNELTPNRTEALDQLRSDNATIDVVLVTVDTLATWIVPDSPLHPSYEDLSLVHRSDYLRSYLMNHHGGGYADIKRDYGDLTSCFDRLDAAIDRWVLGYPEVSARDVSDEPGSVYRRLQQHHHRLPANGAFIARPHTPFTVEWITEVARRVDGFAGRLAGAPGNVLGDNAGYPVPWGALQGATFQPLCYKYADRVLVDERLRPSLVNYR